MDPAAPRRIADMLEPGPLRAELGGAPLPPAPPAEPDGVFVSRLKFTGCGDEYFRIWVVNLFLSLVTLGVYSAWAKVRKTKYFWQNTQLDGHVFDFHGRPVAILRGRIVALVLLVAYTWGFEFSPAAGLAIVALMLALGPWLFVKAQQFRFANTSHRGLRFGFAATRADGYRVVLPILVVWFSSSVAAAFVARDVREGGWILVVVTLATALLIPGMHHRLKAFQHDFATYGERRFAFRPALVEFYWIYTKALLLLVLGAIAGALGSAFPTWLLAADPGPDSPEWLWIVNGVVVALALFVFAWPFLAARVQQLVWAHTRLEDVRFRTAIAAWPLFRLVLRNVGLTLVTCGLYWPYAAVALARYRVECMRVDADVPFATIAAGTFAGTSVAVGDAAADSFGFDVGL